MKYNCDMISDLLPLYLDKACSQSSIEAVEEHLSECRSCNELLESMRSSEEVIDNAIAKERDEVLSKQSKFFKRRSAVAGSIIGGIFAVPILVCLIVNLATGAGLSWFFIVLAAMFIPASLTVVPLMMPKNKRLWTITLFTVSLLVLLAVCCIYSGGNWFFIAASGVLFGLSIPFMPVVVNTKPVAKVLGNNKALAVVGTYTLLYFIMMACVGIKSGSPEFFRISAAFSLPPLIYMWTMFALIRLPKWNGFFKTATCILASVLIYFFNDAIVLGILGNKPRIPSFDFSLTTTESLNNLMCWGGLGIGVVLAVIFTAIGFAKSNKKK
jgi:hypothetical protein